MPFRTRLRTFYIKTFHWEYWPMYLVYFPVSFYYIYLAIKARSFFFFSAANPTIETGGMFFESKWSIFNLIPKEYFPSTIFIGIADDIDQIFLKMKASGIDFPIIAKPDRGERGWCVKKINSFSELADYRKSMNVEFLIQTYIPYPLEFSIFYYRNPKHDKGVLTSVTLKELLSVTGDGHATIDQLIQRNNRAFLQYDRLKQEDNIDFNCVLPKDEKKVLVPYGNHVLGAMFVNYNHIIDDSLVTVFDKISKSIDGFYFGRFDLRCSSIEDLKMGKNIAILELNGSGAEPSHIYHPGFSFFKAQKVIAAHYRMMYEAAMENNKKGIVFMTLEEVKHQRKLERDYKGSVMM